MNIGAPLTATDAAIFDAAVIPRYLANFGMPAVEMAIPYSPATIVDIGCRTGFVEALLAELGLALTYEETRTFLIGLTQANAPTAAARQQIGRVSRALVAVVSSLGLDATAYERAWRRLFTGPANESTVAAATPLSNNPPPDIASSGAAGSASSAARADHAHGHGSQAGGTLHAIATATTPQPAYQPPVAQPVNPAYLQPQGGARVLMHLRGVLLAVVLVGHVVGHGAVFVERLGAALLDVLHLAARRTLDAVAKQGATHDAQDRGCGDAGNFAVVAFDALDHHLALVVDAPTDVGRLYGDAGYQRLRTASVAVVGLGGRRDQLAARGADSSVSSGAASIRPDQPPPSA